MTINSNLQTGLLCAFIIAAIVSAGSKRKAVRGSMPAKVKEHVMQPISTPGGTVAAAWQPPDAREFKSSNQLCMIRVTFNRKTRIENPALMQYMNFDIAASIYVLSNQDTLASTICERIPGINPSEFIYMVEFGKPPAGNSYNLRLCINDTLAGFGKCAFTLIP